MKPISNRKGCIDGVMSGNCITWDGPDIPCLEICTGDTVTKVIYEFGKKFCQALEDSNLSEVDLSCLVNMPSITSSEKTIKKVIELLLQNQCDLKDLIQQDNSTEDTFSVNLKCLKVFDDFDQEIPQTRDQAIQRIVNQVCTNKDDITELKADISDLQEQIDNLDLTPSVELPNVATCLNGTALPLDEVVDLTASEVCGVKTSVGSLSDIQNALTKQCANLGIQLGSPEGFIPTVSNLSQSLTNAWLTICNLLSRINTIETTCCAPTCDSIAIGFSLLEDTDSPGDYLLRFRNTDGTKLPPTAVDLGSKVFFTGANGIKFMGGAASDVNVTLPEGGTGSENTYNLSALTGPITVELLVKVQVGSLVCEKCIKQVINLTSGCPVCLVENTGTTGTVTITYQTF